MDANSLMTAIVPPPAQSASEGGSGGPEVSKTGDGDANGLFKKELGSAMGGAGDSVGAKADPSAGQGDEPPAADDSRAQEQQEEGQVLAAPGNGVPPAPQQLVLPGERGMQPALVPAVAALARPLEPGLGLSNSRSGSSWSPQSVALGTAAADPTQSPVLNVLAANKTTTTDSIKADLSTQLEQRLSAPLNAGQGRGEVAGLLSTPASLIQDNPAGLLATLASGAVPGSGETSVTQGPPMPRFLATLATPFNAPRWQGDFGQQVALLAKSGLQRADIKLNPAHLGPVEVRISISDDQQASVTFFAKHGVVRDAIEASMPRLREMLSEQGMNLVDSQVSQDPRGDRHDQAFGQNSGFGDSGGGAETGGFEEQVMAPEEGTASRGVLLGGATSLDLYV